MKSIKFKLETLNQEEDSMSTCKEKSSLSPLIKKQIVEKLMPLHPEKIILFGSYAYGTPNENSDLDICVVKNYTNKYKEKLQMRELLNSIDMPMDILNPKVDEFEFYKNEINSVYYDIDKQGELLWDNS
jgi:predicted nucleotidyltransferase